jgi:endonuclease VIII
MPEGDTLHRLAAQLQPLVGQVIERLEFPRAHADGRPLQGHTVTTVEARGKNLLVTFDTGQVLHVHLKMYGRVRLFPKGQRPARRSTTVVELTVARAVMVVEQAPVVRLLSALAARGDRLLRTLGPDLLAPTFDAVAAVPRLRARDDLPLGEAVMLQSLVAGIGNVFKSELLFNRHLDPFAPVAAFSDDELTALLVHAREQLQRNARPTSTFVPRVVRVANDGRTRRAAPLSVYGRAGEPCFDCKGTILSELQGAPARTTFWCPTCQPRRR